MSTTNGTVDPDLLAHRRSLRVVANQLLSRLSYLRKLTDPRRDFFDEFGWPRVPTVEDYQLLYDREPIAARVVQVYPREMWKVTPILYSGDQRWEAFYAFCRTLRGESSYDDDEECNPFWDILQRADVLSGIGSYGVLLYGLDDGLPLSQPAAGWTEVNSVPGEKGDAAMPGVYSLRINADPAAPPMQTTAGRKLLYLRPFPETLARVTRFETNWSSPRYGQPTEYTIVLGESATTPTTTAGTTRTQAVHWSRVVHIADVWQQPGDSDVFGVPRIQPVLNPVLDVQKVRGGSAEAYWKNMLMRVFFETSPNVGIGDVDTSSLKDMMEEMENGTQRWAVLAAMAAKTVAPAVVDPTTHVAAQVEAICVQLAMPVPVFKGYEIGEQASVNNRLDWNARLQGRERNYGTPRLIVPAVERLIRLGCLAPAPWSAWWPDRTMMTALERAQVAQATVAAHAAYVGGGVDQLLPPEKYLVDVWDYTEEEAAATLQSAAVGETVEEEPGEGAIPAGGEPAPAPQPATP